MSSVDNIESIANKDKPLSLVERIARPNILSLVPYRCARDDYSEGVLLDANENSFGSPLASPEHQKLSRYPCPHQLSLKTSYAKFRSSQIPHVTIKAEQIFCGVGSDEAIDLLLRIFCAPSTQDSILITPPTYGMYSVCAKINDVAIVKVPLTPDFDLPIEEILAAATPNVKLIFICSPGNPTSKAVPIDAISELCQRFTDGIVVADEAYIDFCQPEQSALNLVPSFQNLVVLQTMSKAFGLAGIRCGYAISSNEHLIQIMNNVKAPYNLNQLTSDLALDVLTSEAVLAKMKSHVAQILAERVSLEKSLAALPFVVKVYPSDANFLLFRLENSAQEAYKRMADVGAVVTRYRGTELHCDECIRVTVGTPEENKAFLQQLVLAWDYIQQQRSQ
eukprot:CAMPEP_0172417434 /NCGR_PEP_ID=MMETSP1064-20121228/3953_1 /TAXON_ID=202472 /ORGANISM="Aulacoseira subarctica , Strain CCAP 1002/5" /LENGTH=391 /DNA_ID=CAMNT_0013155763 /DNA_START=20 /DNA_END=1195 /DNA_ORIENTATION=+